MNKVSDIPTAYTKLQTLSKKAGFSMPSDEQTGSLLRSLVASKPGGSILESGTGTGLATSWMLNGMSNTASLTTIDNNEDLLSIAKACLKDDRSNFICEDGYKWILNNQEKSFDLIFADAMPGKYDLLEETLNLLKPGGIYIIDDMLPQPNWPEGHELKGKALLAHLKGRADVFATTFNWSTGIVIITKKDSAK